MLTAQKSQNYLNKIHLCKIWVSHDLSTYASAPKDPRVCCTVNQEQATPWRPRSSSNGSGSKLWRSPNQVRVVKIHVSMETLEEPILSTCWAVRLFWMCWEEPMKWEPSAKPHDKWAKVRWSSAQSRWRSLLESMFCLWFNGLKSDAALTLCFLYC